MANDWDTPLELILCEEDQGLAQPLADHLKNNGFHVLTAKTLGQAGTLAPAGGVDFIVVGYKDPKRLDVNQIKFSLRSMAGLRMIALLPAGMDSYEELLLSSGVHLVLSRDLPPRQLAQIIVTQGELKATNDQNYRLRQMLDGRTAYGNLLGASAPMRALYRLLDQVARTDAPAMIIGEEGTERVDVARAVHTRSERALHPLIAIDCARRPDDRDGVAVFGPIGGGEFATGPDPERSAFARSGAGVVVLHRIEALGVTAQQRLLDFLHRPFFQNETPGTAQPLARLMITAAPDLAERAEQGRFLRELYYRLSILQVRVPPLRERREDIPMLAQHLLRMALRGRDNNVSHTPNGIGGAALLALFQYAWPGNLEELNQVIRHAAEAAGGEQIELDHLPPALRGDDASAQATPIIASLAEMALKDAKRVFENEYFTGLLRRTRGNMTLASRFSRVGRPYLYKKIREYGIEPGEFR